MLSAAPVVLVDPKWKNAFLAESVMAQLVNWIIRVQGERDVPTLADGALVWWHDWVGRAARRRPGTLSLGEGYEVAPRSGASSNPGRTPRLLARVAPTPLRQPRQRGQRTA